MSLNIYISYGTAEDQVTALRLQALAAVNGFTAYVPPAQSRTNRSVNSEMGARIQECDLFFGVHVLGTRFSPSDACWQERAVALQHNKPRILTGQFGVVADGTPDHQEVILDPEQPDKSESRLLAFLGQSNLPLQMQQALKALATIALGLLMFAPQE